MKKCIKCGNEAIYAKSYFIGNRNLISNWALKGAAVIGICDDCAKPHIISKLNNKKLLALLIFFVLLIISIAVIIIASDAGVKATGTDLLIFLIIGIIMVACIKRAISYSESIKTLETSNDVEFMKGQINDKMIAKTIGRDQIISENIIFNWDALNTKRGAVSADFTKKAFISEIRTPFESNILGMLILEGIMDVSIETLVKPPLHFMHEGLDEEGKELIRQACESYQKEEYGWYQFASNQSHVIIQSLL